MHALPMALCVTLSIALPAVLADDSAPKPPAAGQRFEYTGKLEAVNDSDADSPLRTFRIVYVVLDAAGGTGRLAWVLEEGTGEPRWPWPQRFGQVTLRKDLHSASDRELPAIQAERDGSVRAIPVRLPVFAGSERLRPDAAWQEDPLRFEVLGRDEISGRRSWRVGISSNLGPREVVWVDEADGVVTRHREIVFLGQGIPHELSLDLVKTTTLAADELARESKAHEAMAALRGPVKDRLVEWQENTVAATEKLLEQARQASTQIQQELKRGVWVDLAKDTVRELQGAMDRDGELERIRKRTVGKPAKAFTLGTTRGEKVSLADYKGKPVVLHFWEYRSEPKVAPYGETGFLDFMWRQRQKEGVRVLGIAVDQRSAEAASRAAARKDVRAFCEFMNLSYPVAFDDGEQKVIDQFGDPRAVGGKLPLYVLIAADGTVTEYHAGLWSSAADEGLKELDQRVKKLIEASQ